MSLEWPTQNTEVSEQASEDKAQQARKRVMELIRTAKERGEDKVLEQELSSEQLNQAMAKVQDINKEGTAYTCLTKDNTPEMFARVLKDGLLGSDGKSRVNREKWAKTAHNERKGIVFFNIIGRDSTSEWSEHEMKSKIEDSYYVRPNHDYTKTVVLFDMASFSEETPIKERWDGNRKNRTYVNGSIGLDKWKEMFKELHPHNNRDEIIDIVDRNNKQYEDDFTSTGETKSVSEFGFTLSFRVAPRLLKGIVFKFGKRSNSQQEVKKIVELMLNNKKVLLPIYDIAGNLLWPKQMSHEEVQQLVAERDTKNTNKEEK